MIVRVLRGWTSRANAAAYSSGCCARRSFPGSPRAASRLPRHPPPAPRRGGRVRVPDRDALRRPARRARVRGPELRGGGDPAQSPGAARPGRRARRPLHRGGGGVSAGDAAKRLGPPAPPNAIEGVCWGRRGRGGRTRPPNGAQSALAALGARDQEGLTGQAERVALGQGEVLFEPEQESRSVWFPEGCVVSLMVVMAGGQSAEAASVGREGMVGANGALGGLVTVTRALVAVPGPALRLPAPVLRQRFEASGPLRRLCLCHADALLAQVLQLGLRRPASGRGPAEPAPAPARGPHRSRARPAADPGFPGRDAGRAPHHRHPGRPQPAAAGSDRPSPRPARASGPRAPRAHRLATLRGDPSTLPRRRWLKSS